MKRIRIGVLGCGKVTESFHLPVVAQNNACALGCLVDAHLPRAEMLAGRHGIAQVFADYRKAIDHVDAVILATPNHLHAPMAIDLLQNGIHVLVEKPMALSAMDCEAMLKAEKASGRVLAIGLVRRFYAVSRFVKQAIDNGLLGKIIDFDFQEGGIFSWPVTTDFMFRKEAGGGVLADIGIHTLDLLLWWLGGVDSVAYVDDARGGVEADCRIHLKLIDGASGSVALSRLRKMRNTYIIVGERGTLEVGTSFDSQISLTLKGQSQLIKGAVMTDGQPDRSMHDVFQKQLNDFVKAINSGTQALVTGDEGSRAVKLIEACRNAREMLEYPWSLAARQSEVH